jgi:hypothetical protein
MGTVPTAVGRHGSDDHAAKGRLPAEGGLSERVREARERALEHEDHDRPRAPRPDRMQR